MALCQKFISTFGREVWRLDDPVCSERFEMSHPIDREVAKSNSSRKCCGPPFNSPLKRLRAHPNILVIDLPVFIFYPFRALVFTAQGKKLLFNKFCLCVS